MKFHYILFVLFPMLMIGQTNAEKKEALKKQEILFAVNTPNKNFTETVSFEDPYNQMIVAVVIDGQTYHFLFDTGALTVVSPQLKEKLTMKQLFSTKIIDGAGVIQEEKIFNLPSLQLGKISFNNVAAAVIDLTKFEKMFCIKIDGIFGTNIMRTCNWKLDYSNRQITFSDKKIKPSWKAIEIDFEENFSGSPMLRLHMGGFNFSSIMDTGYNGGFSLPDSLYFKSTKAGKLKVYKSRGKSSFTLLSGQAEVNEHMVLIDSMYVGNKLFKNRLSKIEPGGLLIGNKFFKEFGELIIDWNKDKLYLPDVPFKEDTEYGTFGFLPVKTETGVFVGTIWEGSEAQKQGMELGDSIISINRVEMLNLPQDKWCSLVPLFKEDGAPGVDVVIKKKDGSQKTLHITRYNIFNN